MAAPPNVELEAAKFLHKLIQESKDEPSKLATKLYVILQHMRSSGKENSMPYQVISRAMETVINQHGLDIDALMSSRLPLTTGIQVGDSASSQFGGSSLRGAIAKEASASMPSSELNKIDAYASNRPPAGPSSAGHNIYQGSVSHLNSKSLDHESPSSFNTRPVKSHSEERRDSLNWEKANKKDNKEGSSKRKRADTSLTSERQSGNLQPLDTNTCSSGMDKVATKIDQHRSLSIHGGEHGCFNNTIQISSQMEHMTSLNSAMRSVLRAKQETQHQAEKSLDSTNISNSLSRVPHSRHPEEMEVSSTHNASGRQQEGSLQSTNDALNSRGLWNQTKIGLPFEKSQVQKFPFHASGGDSSAETFMHQSVTSPLGSGAAGKVYGTAPGALGPYAAAESGIPSPTQFSSSFDNHGLGPKMHKDRSMEAFSSAPSVDLPFYKGTLGKALEHEGGILHTSANANNTVQGGMLNNITETTMLRSTGKSPISQSPAASGMPFKDQHLKQLRAQCLVYLAFRNGLMPKKLHLDIALGNNFPKEDGPSKEMIDQKGKEQSVDGPSSTPDVTIPVGRLDNPRETERSRLGPSSIGMFTDANLSKEGDSMNMVGGKSGVPSGQMKTEVTGWTGNGCNDESVPVPERKDNAPSQSFRLGDHNFQGSQHADAYLPSFPLREQPKPLSRMDGGNHLESQVVETDQEEEDISVSTDLLPSPKYTTSEKWIMDQQKRKLLSEQTWALKQQKTKQRITACADKLKDNVSSSEDISAKTRSVIELKKLQLLELQNRLRNDILNDFFKPITSDMDCLKSIKKHRIGRRSKQLEKFEQKMKEERQKRFRERQKEFFSEIEVHKERVEDVLKMRRERWKGFNKYAREFHKRKERVHREKIDRIQREKINLLKVNDVEGYLRMVQDAKSDRVKQLLKETEKYLQKLGSKLQDAKATSRCFETEMDDNRSAGVMEKSEITIENEDETDQAKHYLESNEKYYLMAHSIKENVAEQPSCLVGGKLREYQMNGLRWLVSLYNNHLNGILADEMGLGKTVQVISLICYLMETKNDRGPFLVVVPSSVLPGWDSEINFWAPSINKIVYSGPPEERRRLFKERIVPRKFNVLLTTYEYLMNKHDRPKLSKIHWHYVIIDEGHRIKNASCKLNADLKLYRSSHRLLLTGTPLQNNLEELWALLNFLLPNIFNSSEDFSQWFNKPFESNGDSSPDQALLSEEENLLIINRLHQVLRPFVLRRLKHKVENELPEKIERLVRCEASAYQKLLMKRVEENLGALGTSKARSVHNSVMELRNICNHPYLSQLHVEEVHDFIPKHYLPNVVRLCGKLEMLDRILPKLKATDHRVLLFSTMTRLLDVMEDYLYWKQYKYLRLDGHTCGGDRGALIDQFNKPGSPYFIFLLSIRAGGVGVNLQAADTVIIFDTDWNPQVDLQAQARAHRIGQKREVLVLRFETVQTVEEQVRAAAEHKLGVANQSITAGFFDNNTSAEDRREYLESLLRESKKEEVAPVLHDDALNDLIARSESEIDIFESVDRSRQEEEMAAWKLELGHGTNGSESVLALPSRLLMDDDLKLFCEAMQISDAPTPAVVSNVGVKRKNEYLGGLDTQHYGRGKRAREVRSYEEQWTEDEFEKMCQVESPQSPKLKGEVKEMILPMVAGESYKLTVKTETMVSSYQPTEPPKPSVQPPPLQLAQPPSVQLAQPPSVQLAQPPLVQSAQPPLVQSAQPPVVQSAQPPPVQSAQPPQVQSAKPPPVQSAQPPPVQSAQPPPVKSAQSPLQQPVQLSLPLPAQPPLLQPPQQSKEVTPPSKRGRGRPKRATTQIPPSQMVVPTPSGAIYMDVGSQRGTVSICSVAPGPESLTSSSSMRSVTGTIHQFGILSAPSSQATATLPSASSGIQSTTIPCPFVPIPDKRRGRKAKSGGETPRRRGRKPSTVLSAAQVLLAPSGTDNSTIGSQGEIISSLQFASGPDTISCLVPAKDVGKETSTISLVPVLLPSSGIVKLSVESQETQVSSSPIFSSSSILTGTSDHTLDLHVGTAGSQPTPQMVPVPPDSQSISMGTDPSSQPNPPFPSVPLGPQSVPPSHSLPKQLKGRGRKAQSEGEAPRRRGRKQDAASTVVPDKSGDQEPTSTEPPEKKSRVSAGRKAIVTRSKQQNEAQKLMNLIQAEVSNVHTSLGFSGLDSVVTGESYQSAQNKLGTSSSGSIHVAATSRDKESSNIKDNQLDAMISGDGILSTKIEDCLYSEDPAGKEIHNAGVKDVSPAIKEVTGDNQSSETEIHQSLSSEPGDELIGVSKPSFLEVSVTQSSDSKTYSELSTLGTAPVSDLRIRMRGTQSGKEGGEKVEEMIRAPLGVIATSNPEFSESEGKRSVAVLISSTTISEQLTDTRIGADDDLGGPTLSDTNTDVTENQSLEERKCSALSTSETMTVTQNSDDKSNTASSTLGTDRVSDLGKIATPSEKGGGEKVEEVIKPLHDGSATPTPKVHKPASLRNAADFVQNIAVPDKSIEESLKSKDDNGTAVHYVGEKSMEAKDSVVDITAKVVSYTEAKLVEVNDAMVEIRESVHSYEEKEARDRKGKDVRSLGTEYMSDNAAGATNVLNSDADGVVGFLEEESLVVKKVMIDGNISKEYSGEKLGSRIHAVVAPEDNVKDYAAVEKSEVKREFEANESSESKGENVSPQTLELKHDFVEVESLMKERETKPYEEVVEAFKGAADHERREHQGVQSHAIGDAVTEVGQSQTQVKEGGYKGRSEYREQGEFKPEIDSGCPDTMEEKNDVAAVEGTMVQIEKEPSKGDIGIFQGETQHGRREQQGGGPLHAVGVLLGEIDQTTKEILVAQGHVKEGGYAGIPKEYSKEGELKQVEEGGPEYMEENHQLSETGIIERSKPKSSEEVEEVSQGAIENEKRDHVGGGLHVIIETIEEIGEAKEELLVGLGQTQTMLEECSKQEEFREKVWQDEKRVPETTEERHDTAAGGTIDGEEVKPSEKIKEVCDRVTNERKEKEQQVSGVLEDTRDATVEIRQTMEELLVKQCLTQAEEEVFQQATEPERWEHGGEVVYATEETTTKIGQMQNELLVKQSLTQADKAKTFEKVKEVFEETVQHERMEQQEGGVFHSPGETLAKIEQTTEEINVELCQTQAEAKPNERVEVLEVTEPERSEYKEGGVFHVVGETASEFGLTEELLVEQCQTRIEQVIPPEKVQVFQGATAHEIREQNEGRVLHACAESIDEFGQTTEEILVGLCQTEAKEAKADVIIKEVFQEATEHDKMDHPEDGVLHSIMKTVGEIRQTTEQLLIEPCQTIEEQTKPSGINEEVLHAVTETSVEIGQRLEEPPLEQLKTRAKEEPEPSSVVEEFLNTGAETKVEIGQIVEELPIEQCQIQTKEDSEPSEMVNVVLHAGVETVGEVGQRLEELPIGQCQTLEKADSKPSEKAEVFQGANVHEKMEQGGRVLQTGSVSTGVVGQTLEELPVQQRQTQSEESEPSKKVEVFLNIGAETAVETVQIVEELPFEQCQIQTKEDSEPSEMVEVVLHAGVETIGEVGQRLEELPIEQCHTLAKADSKPSEKAEEVFQGANVHDTMEQGGRVLQTGSENTGEVGQTLEELTVQQCQTQLEESAPSKKVEVSLNIGAETAVEIGQIVEELPIEQCQIQTKEDSEPSEMVKVVLHACVETIGEVGQRLEELPIGQCRTLAKVDSKPSEKAEEVFEGANVHDTTEQGGRVLQTGSECTVETVQIVEELPFEQCQIQTKEDSEPSEMVKVVLDACVEIIGEVGQRLEEIPIGQCQTLAKADSKPSEKAEEVFEGANVHDTTEQGGRVLQTGSECTVEVGQTLEELPVQRHQTQSKEESEPSKMAKVFQEAIVDERSEQQESGVLHAIVETAVEIRQTKDVLGECQTQAEDAKPSEQVKEVLLGENAHDRRIQQRSRVLHAGAEATVEIGQREEELPVKQCRTLAKEDSEPSEKAEILQEAIEHERKEELGGDLLQAIETSDFIELKTEEPVGMSQTQAKDEVKHSEKVEAFHRVTEHDRREEQGGAVSHIPGETIDETGQTKQEGLAECQTEVNEADRPNEVKEVTHEGTKNEGMEQQVGIVVHSIEKLTEELIEPDRAQEKEGASTGSSGDFEKGRVDA